MVVVILLLFFPEVAISQTGSAPKDSDTLFPPNEILVLLANDQSQILLNPGSETILGQTYQRYGKPEIKQTFSQVGFSQDGSELQIERILQKYSLRQKARRVGITIPKIPPLHRFYNLKFDGDAKNVPLIINDLKKSPNIAQAMPNVVLKAQAETGSPYYSTSLGWAKPYLEPLGIPEAYAFALSFLTPNQTKRALNFLNTNLAPARQSYDIANKVPGTHQFVGRPPIPVDSCTRETMRDREACAADEIIVRYKDEVTEEQIHSTHQKLGMTALKKFKFFKTYVVKLPSGMSVNQALETYALRNDILYAEPHYKYFNNATTPNDDYYPNSQGYQWALDNQGYSISGNVGTPDADIDAPEAWDLTTGSDDVVVAVIDSGINFSHVDFYDSAFPYALADDVCTFSGGGSSGYANLQVSNIWTNDEEWYDRLDDDSGAVTAYDVQHTDSNVPANGYDDDFCGWDFTNTNLNTYGTNSPSDIDGHGTAVAGIIGARGNNNFGIVGVSWNTSLMALQVSSSDEVVESYVLDAISYAGNNGADIVNMSWGGYTYSQALKDAIDLYASVLFVAGAGNDGYDVDFLSSYSGTYNNMFYPASFTSANIIAVAATDNDDNLTAFSNYGTTSIDVAAPGEDIAAPGTGNSFFMFDGTSAAAPHVSGIASLLWSYYPGITAEEAKACILQSVDAKSSLSGKVVSGGRVNAYGALQCGTAMGLDSIADEAEDCDETSIPIDSDGDGFPDGSATFCKGDLDCSFCSLDSTHAGRQPKLLNSILGFVLIGLLALRFYTKGQRRIRE